MMKSGPLGPQLRHRVVETLCVLSNPELRATLNGIYKSLREYLSQFVSDEPTGDYPTPFLAQLFSETFQSPGCLEDALG